MQNNIMPLVGLPNPSPIVPQAIVDLPFLPMPGMPFGTVLWDPVSENEPVLQGEFGKFIPFSNLPLK